MGPNFPLPIHERTLMDSSLSVIVHIHAVKDRHSFHYVVHVLPLWAGWCFHVRLLNRKTQWTWCLWRRFLIIPQPCFGQPSRISQNSAHSKLSHLIKSHFAFMTRGIMSVFKRSKVIITFWKELPYKTNRQEYNLGIRNQKSPLIQMWYCNSQDCKCLSWFAHL